MLTFRKIFFVPIIIGTMVLGTMDAQPVFARGEKRQKLVDPNGSLFYKATMGQTPEGLLNPGDIIVYGTINNDGGGELDYTLFARYASGQTRWLAGTTVGGATPNLRIVARQAGTYTIKLVIKNTRGRVVVPGMDTSECSKTLEVGRIRNDEAFVRSLPPARPGCIRAIGTVDIFVPDRGMLRVTRISPYGSCKVTEYKITEGGHFALLDGGAPLRYLGEFYFGEPTAVCRKTEVCLTEVQIFGTMDFTVDCK